MRLRAVVACGILGCALACGGGGGDAGEAGVVITIPDGHRLGGTASGIAGQLVLVEATAGRVELSGDGPFWFATRLPFGTPYTVAVSGTVPSDRFCSVSNATGTMPRADVDTLLVTCRPLSPAGAD